MALNWSVALSYACASTVCSVIYYLNHTDHPHTHIHTHTHTHTYTHTHSPLATCEVCVSIHPLWGPPFLLEVSEKKNGCLVAYFPISLNTWLDRRKFQFDLWGLSYEDLPINQLWILMGTNCHTILMGTCSPNLWGLCSHTLLARTNSSVEEEEKGKACLVVCLPVSIHG